MKKLLPIIVAVFVPSFVLLMIILSVVNKAEAPTAGDADLNVNEAVMEQPAEVIVEKPIEKPKPINLKDYEDQLKEIAEPLDKVDWLMIEAAKRPDLALTDREKELEAYYDQNDGLMGAEAPELDLQEAVDGILGGLINKKLEQCQLIAAGSCPLNGEIIKDGNWDLETAVTAIDDYFRSL
jgi:hypothetical protein